MYLGICVYVCVCVLKTFDYFPFFTHTLSNNKEMPLQSLITHFIINNRNYVFFYDAGGKPCSVPRFGELDNIINHLSRDLCPKRPESRLDHLDAYGSQEDEAIPEIERTLARGVRS